MNTGMEYEDILMRNQELMIENSNNTNTITTLLVEQKKMYEMYEERIRQLAAERDEARREVCELKSYNFNRLITPKAYAELRKWDCFNDKTEADTNNTLFRTTDGE